jgi:hypothetical protein
MHDECQPLIELSKSDFKKTSEALDSFLVSDMGNLEYWLITDEAVNDVVRSARSWLISLCMSWKARVRGGTAEGLVQMADVDVNDGKLVGNNYRRP